jgi:hypothetical protein
MVAAGPDMSRDKASEQECAAASNALLELDVHKKRYHDISPTPCGGQVILHLSDLHFGYDENHDMKVARAIVLGDLVESLSQVDSDWRPTIVCVTGDIAYRARKEEYKEAAVWLYHLLDTLGLGSESLLVCPGNHDVQRDKWERLLRPEKKVEADEALAILSEDNPIARHWRDPFENCEGFCRDLDIPPYKFGTDGSYLVGNRKVKGVNFVCL